MSITPRRSFAEPTVDARALSAVTWLWRASFALIVVGLLVFHWREELSLVMAVPSAEWSRSIIVGEVDNSRPPALVTLPPGVPGGGVVVAWGGDTEIGLVRVDAAGVTHGAETLHAPAPVYSLALALDGNAGKAALGVVRAYWLDNIDRGALYTAKLGVAGKPGGTEKPGLTKRLTAQKLADSISAFAVVRDVKTGTAAPGGGLVFSDGERLYYSPGYGTAGAPGAQGPSGTGGQTLSHDVGARLPDIISLDAARLSNGGIAVAASRKPGYVAHEYHVFYRDPSGLWQGPWKVARIPSGWSTQPGPAHIAIATEAGGGPATAYVSFGIESVRGASSTGAVSFYQGRLGSDTGAARNSPQFTAARIPVGGPFKAGNALVTEIADLSPGPAGPEGAVMAAATANVGRSMSDESREVVEVTIRDRALGPVSVASARRGVALSPAIAADSGGVRYAAWLVTAGFGRYRVAAAGTGAAFRAGLGKSGAGDRLEAAWNLFLRYGMAYVALVFGAWWLMTSFAVVVLGYLLALTWSERFPARLWFMSMAVYLGAKVYFLPQYYYTPSFRWIMPGELAGTAGMLTATLAFFAVALLRVWIAWRSGGRLRSAFNAWGQVALVDMVLTVLLWTPYFGR